MAEVLFFKFWSQLTWILFFVFNLEYRPASQKTVLKKQQMNRSLELTHLPLSVYETNHPKLYENLPGASLGRVEPGRTLGWRVVDWQDSFTFCMDLCLPLRRIPTSWEWEFGAGPYLLGGKTRACLFFP